MGDGASGGHTRKDTSGHLRLHYSKDSRVRESREYFPLLWQRPVLTLRRLRPVGRCEAAEEIWYEVPEGRPIARDREQKQ